MLAHSGAVFKDLSTTDANKINRGLLELHYLRLNGAVLERMLFLTAKKFESKDKLEIEMLDKEQNINKCVIVLTSEFIWHFDKEFQMLNEESSLIETGLKLTQELEKNNFDCSLYEKEIFDLFNKYGKKI